MLDTQEDDMPTYQDKPVEELQGVKNSILDQLEELRFLRLVMRGQETDLKRQLAEVEARMSPVVGISPSVYNGTTQPTSPDASEESI